ncbi:MAG TPA: prolyl oligopeptidase family serine peptidase [Phycisphaerae bacterium]|nr:prolyl oligopeptidase family serine peptidase [Phycisphaerae bacterium]HRW54421.1 prolyl oligopeptidase family serine peptidase [Phycisphaerae bacterium]
MMFWRSSSIRCTVACLAALCAAPALADGVDYPETRTVDVVDTIHGEKIADPYRWLEDDNADDTKAWVRAENDVTFGYLDTIPERAAIESRLTELWNYERYGTPTKKGGRYFYSRNDGLQNQSVIYTVRSINDTPKELLDPNKLSSDGTVALSGIRASEDGKYFAYGVSDGGSDWQTYRVRDIESGRDLDDVIEWIKFSGVSWTKKGDGFFYSRYDAPKPGEELSGSNYYQKLYFHKLGTPQADDTLVYERPDQKDWGFGGEVTEDGNYLIISVWQGTERKNRIYYKDLHNPNAEVVKMLDDYDAEYAFLGNDGSTFYFRTDLSAPKGRIISIDAKNPARANWKEIVPEAAETLEGAGILNNWFVLNYLKDARTQVKIFDKKGEFVREVELPGIGSADGFNGRSDDTETFYAFNSFSTPTTVYHYDLISGRSKVFKAPKVNFNPDDFVTNQVFYTSKDGTRIPMFITHKRGLKLDGNNPTYLYGYGGFNISLTPRFSLKNIAWLEMGGVYAQANLRGGGEYGKAWHDAGRLLNKQNVFDDFISAAEWLIANKYTQTKKLAIGGGSNGGLLVGACITQRPELFGAALPAVGVMDMLRFQLFTIGHAWTSDYGRIEDEKIFRKLRSYSPYHNVKKGACYPPTMITTGDHDDRVVPAHSFKFAAALQAAQSCDNPVLIRIETRAGHGAGKPTSIIIKEVADSWAFLVKNLDMQVKKSSDKSPVAAVKSN